MQPTLMAMDPRTLRPLARADLIGPDGALEHASYHAILLSPPPPPLALAHTVSGRSVELTWRDPGDATHFLIQVGSEPGRSNLGTFHVGAVTQFGSEVPPGRYYVRARAVNDVGLSVPSNEVVVEVP